MSRIFSYLHPRYHEAFYADAELDLPVNAADLRRECFSGPGFWYTIDVYGCVVRTGCARDIPVNIDKFLKQSNEIKIRILTSYWSGDGGYRSMKNYKQCFRRVMKHLPKHEEMNLNDVFGSCYTFELTNIWNKK